MFRNEAHGHPALTHGWCDHPRRPRANVANRKNPGATRLKKEGLTTELFPGRPIASSARRRRSGQDEAVVVERDGTSEPFGSWLGADQDDDPSCHEHPAITRPSAFHDDTLDMTFTLNLSYLVSQEHFDVALNIDSIAQVASHRTLETLSANHEVSPTAILCKGERRLTG